MQVVKNIFIVSIVIVLIGACASSNVQVSNKNKYSIKKYQSGDGGSYLSLNFYNLEKKTDPIPAVFEVNGILFGPNDDLKNYVISIRPGSYKIRGGYVGKEWTQLTVSVTKRDSLIVKIFLKDDPEPLH